MYGHGEGILTIFSITHWEYVEYYCGEFVLNPCEQVSPMAGAQSLFFTPHTKNISHNLTT